MLGLTISQNADRDDHKDNPKASYSTANPNLDGSIRNCEETKELDQKWWRILIRISFYKYFWRAHFHRHLLSAKCSFNLTSVVPKIPVRLPWNNPGIVQYDHQDAETMSQILTNFQKQLVANLFLTSKMMLVCWMTHDSDNYETSPAQCKPYLDVQILDLF